jgi:hypothetical protein
MEQTLLETYVDLTRMCDANIILLLFVTHNNASLLDIFYLRARSKSVSFLEADSS